MDIGHRMKELRIQYGLTQQELAAFRRCLFIVQITAFIP